MEFGNGGDFLQIVGSLIPGQGEVLLNAGKSMSLTSLDGVFGFDKSFALTTLDLKISADVSTAIETGDMKLSSKIGFAVEAVDVKIAAKVGFAVDATTVSIKGKTGELLALVKELLEGIGACTPASPTGPCAPIQGAPQWAAKVLPALTKLAGMTG